MSPLRLAGRGLQQRAVSSIIAALAVAVACCLLMLVWALKKEAEQGFLGADGGFDAVLGPRGSKLQIVLNALYHMDESPGLMRWSDYEQVKSFPPIAAAYPIAVGDNYRGFRIVGTVPEYLAEHSYRDGRKFELETGGRLFAEDDLEAVVGSQAAQQLGLGVGDTFHPYHGLLFDEAARHAEIYTVVGVLKPTGTPADKAIWSPISGVQNMSGHDPNAATDVSAVLVRLQPGANMAGFQLDMRYNRQGDRLTFAWPVSRTMLQFFEKLGWFDQILQGIAVAVALIAGSGITAVLYNAMSERSREIATLRALGARRTTVFSIALLESLGIALGGVAASFALYAASGAAIASVVRERSGVALDVFAFNDAFWWVPLSMLIIGLTAGAAPAIKAYRNEVSRNLT